MRKWSIILVVTSLWLVGCQEQMPVELTLDNPDQVLQASQIVEIDSLAILDSSIDTTGVLYNEEKEYGALLLVNGVKSDLSTGRETFSFSRIFMNWRNRPIVNEGKVKDYNGMPMDIAQLRRGEDTFNLPAVTRPYRTVHFSLPLPISSGRTYDSIGHDKIGAQKKIYNPQGHYSFLAKGRYSTVTISEEIDAPSDITVTEPQSNSVIVKKENLTVRWSGAIGESFQVVMSIFSPTNHLVVKPVMKIQVQSGSNSITIPSKALQALEQSPNNRYMLSFISSNRKVKRIVDGGLEEKVLIQASSIHNIILWLK
ncbi:MAG: hypothetical protein V1799_09170 [bacterium]